MSNLYHFDEETRDRVDRFALNLVKEYRRYVAGIGHPTEEAGKLFGCAVFAHYLAKCSHTQKVLEERGIPPNPNACYEQRHHFFMCTGTVYCKDLSDHLIRCVKKTDVSDMSGVKQHCKREYDAFLHCYITKVTRDYGDEEEKST